MEILELVKKINSDLRESNLPNRATSLDWENAAYIPCRNAWEFGRVAGVVGSLGLPFEGFDSWDENHEFCVKVENKEK